MHNEFTAVIERDDDWFVAWRPEIPGANGQGRTREESLESLASAIELILEDRREDAHRGVPEDAIRAVEAVPRHVEVPDLLARKICRGLGLPEIGR